MTELKWAQNIFSKDEKDDEIWKRWVIASQHSSRELAEIVHGQFKEEFQRRALFLLLIPDERLTPFYWLPLNHNRESIGNYLAQELDFRKVEAGLRAHAVYWLTKFIDYTRYQLSDYCSQTVWLDIYNKYIIQLLIVLPQEDNNAENIFPYFTVNDSDSWISGKEHSGYNPLLSLWKNPLVPERWKKSADAQIRQVIKSELAGNSQPRRPYENALKCYAQHLQSMIDANGFLMAYSREFFADQLNFLISLEVSDQQLINSDLVGSILNNIEKNAALKWKLCRFVVLRDGNFKIFNDQTEETAKMILGACGTDSQVTTIIRDQLLAYQENQKKQLEQLEKQKRAKEALLVPMQKISPAYKDENWQ